MKVNIDKYVEAFKSGAPKLNIKAKDAALSEEEETIMNEIAVEMRRLQGMKLSKMLTPLRDNHNTLVTTIDLDNLKLSAANKIRFYLGCRIKQIPVSMQGCRNTLKLIHNTTQDHIVLNIMGSIHKSIKKLGG